MGPGFSEPGARNFIADRQANTLTRCKRCRSIIQQYRIWQSAAVDITSLPWGCNHPLPDDIFWSNLPVIW